MTRSAKRNNLWISILASTVFPVALGLSLSYFLPDLRWDNYPFHAMLESVGALSALTIATLIIILINNDHLARRFIVVAAALIGMGLLDGFHALLHAGVSFVWLHSIATMVGGIMFSTVWLPEIWWTKKRQTLLLFSITLFALLSGLISVTAPHILPTMIIDGQFSLLATVINFAGGIGFLIGTSFFIYSCYSRTNQPQISQKSRTENIVFTNHCLLFGIAGLLFETSVLWDAGWWWWHILRFAAYAVVLVYFFILFNQSQSKLKSNEIMLKNINNELEVRVQQRTAELSNAIEELEAFSYSVSHDLRAPLRGIDGFSLVLLEDYADVIDETGQDYLQRVRKGAQKIGTLIDALLDLSRVSQHAIETTPVALDELANDIIQQLREYEPDRQIEVTIAKNISVNGDKHLLHIVLDNLLSNAWKYTLGTEPANIEFNTYQQDGETIYYIKDNGAGFDMQYADKLFDAFQRLHGEEFEGTGIGLATVQRCIRRHGGRIWAEAEVNHGATFSFSLSATAPG